MKKSTLCTIEKPDRYVIQNNNNFYLTDNYNDATDFIKIQKFSYFISEIYKKKIQNKMNFHGPEISDISLRWKYFEFVTADFTTNLSFTLNDLWKIIRYLLGELKKELIVAFAEAENQALFEMEEESKKKKNKKEKTLKDFDKLKIGNIGEQISGQENFKFGLEEKNMTCSLCNGNMIEIDPQIKLNELILHECSTCGERRYI